MLLLGLIFFQLAVNLYSDLMSIYCVTLTAGYCCDKLSDSSRLKMQPRVLIISTDLLNNSISCQLWNLSMGVNSNKCTGLP